jgi:hypothetical protein
MKRCSVVALAVAVCLGYVVAVASAQIPCLMPGFSQLPFPPTGLALGNTVYHAAITYPDVANAIVGARDVWNGTNAKNRIAWNGSVHLSDCPTGQSIQIGAFDFMNTNCPTPNGSGAVALTDYSGTKSISLNLHFMFSTSPQPGQYDIQSVLAHEFGHLLGLAHMTGDQCTFNSQTCGFNPNVNTMTSFIENGQTCYRDLAMYDILNANSVYPP